MTLRFSYHVWDEQLFDSHEAYTTALKQCEPLLEPLKLLNPRLWDTVNEFLFVTDKAVSWGEHNIAVNWQSPVLKDHLDKNWKAKPAPFGLGPGACYLPQELCPTHRIHGKTIRYFEDVQQLFKFEIELMPDDLYWMILSARRANKDQRTTVIPKLFVTSFVDVVALRKGIELIVALHNSADCWVDQLYSKGREVVRIHFNSDEDPMNALLHKFLLGVCHVIIDRGTSRTLLLHPDTDKQGILCSTIPHTNGTTYYLIFPE